ncbi:MAG: hypothetical protein ACTS43_00300 [Candidatus Hodgkinia cicadicola]
MYIDIIANSYYATIVASLNNSLHEYLPPLQHDYCFERFRKWSL